MTVVATITLVLVEDDDAGGAGALNGVIGISMRDRRLPVTRVIALVTYITALHFLMTALPY
jgi:hypothetical protein